MNTKTAIMLAIAVVVFYVIYKSYYGSTSDKDVDEATKKVVEATANTESFLKERAKGSVAPAPTPVSIAVYENLIKVVEEAQAVLERAGDSVSYQSHSKLASVLMEATNLINVYNNYMSGKVTRFDLKMEANKTKEKVYKIVHSGVAPVNGGVVGCPEKSLKTIFADHGLANSSQIEDRVNQMNQVLSPALNVAFSPSCPEGSLTRQMYGLYKADPNSMPKGFELPDTYGDFLKMIPTLPY